MKAQLGLNSVMPFLPRVATCAAALALCAASQAFGASNAPTVAQMIVNKTSRIASVLKDIHFA